MSIQRSNCVALFYGFAMVLNVKLIFFLIFLFSIDSYARQKYYVVEKGDTLSAIVFDLTGGPLWGNDSEMIKVLKDNPQIKDPDLIYPGQKIIVKAYYGESSLSTD